MIKNIQITGDADMHPEKPVHDIRELASGKIDLSKLSILDHHIEVFDLMDKDQRSAYNRLYVELAEASKRGQIYISSNTREILTRPDGSTGWFKYLEWTEFDVSDILGA